jgi:hypothetical protein
MKILAFISEDCANCDLWKKLLINEDFPFSSDDNDPVKLHYIDAFADETQDFCDTHEVDELPRVKIMDDSDKIIFNEIGFFHPEKLWDILYPLMSVKKKIAKFNLSKFKK